MVTEATARVLKQMIAGQIQVAGKTSTVDSQVAKVNQEMVKGGPIIDIQTVYDDFTDGVDAVEFYEAELRPPWITSIWAYENRFGNALVMIAVTEDTEEEGSKWSDGAGGLYDELMYWQSSADTHTIDWDRVRWKWLITFWAGDGSKAHGPLFLVKIAVYDDGVPADIAWQCMYPEGHRLADPSLYQTELAMLIRAVDIANCRNVEAVESKPSGDRAARRRTQRQLGDIKVSQLSITPKGKSYRGPGANGQGGSTPLTSVRGHVAHYGACCPHHPPKGLLFGKYTCRVWVPEHERGDENHGQNLHTYEVKT